MTPAPLPASLKIVAFLFILSGVLAIFEVLFAFFQNRISLNFTVFNLFIGLGLLRLNPRSWVWAMIVTGLVFLLVLLVTIVFLFVPVNMRLFGISLGQAPPGVGFVMGLASLALLVWQYRVLDSAQVRRLFRR